MLKYIKSSLKTGVLKLCFAKGAKGGLFWNLIRPSAGTPRFFADFGDRPISISVVLFCGGYNEAGQTKFSREAWFQPTAGMFQ